jgi:hypothetical protein
MRSNAGEYGFLLIAFNILVMFPSTLGSNSNPSVTSSYLIWIPRVFVNASLVA